MTPIRQLPPDVVNKIAAGEVIERPGSVVKELMENAIDAGATRIDVAVEQGGLELVRISDNGRGIAADQLPLAVASHATSKIADADDLFRVQTLGFRGEALASIAAVSRLVLRSRPESAREGAELEVAGGHSSAVIPCGCATGTTAEVRRLFYNTPVRRKFLRSTQTEMGHATEAFTRVALAYSHVHCTLEHNGRSVYDLPRAADWRDRIAAFFGHVLAADLIAVESVDGAVELAGYVASPSHSRANPRLQYLFLNGRSIRDRSLGHALSEAYRGLLLTGRYPIAFLRIGMPADMVDVNVHPTKLEVRFQESGKLYGQLLGTLRTKFLTTDLTARLQPAAQNEAATAVDPQSAERMRRELVDWAKGRLADFGSDEPPPSDVPTVQSRFDEKWPAPRAPLELSTLDRRREPADRSTGDDEPPRDAAAAHRVDRPPAPARPVNALQLHNRYLVTESDDGMVVIDQHALHERILYEHLRERVLSGALESQALLVPEPVDLSPAEAAAALASRDVLAQLGVSIEPFGGDTVLVSSFPAMLANFRPAEVLRDLVDQLLSGGKQPERRDVVDSLLHMISCKAAIKAGDRLSPAEISALLEQRHLARDTHHCPHGRPTALFFSRAELDRQFKRT
ncbi:MAG: DNA mismatch repair endonuclease MutL [Pirellulales bacterium]